MFVSGLFWDGTLYNLDFFIRQLESVILSTVQRGQLKLYVLSQWLADLPKYEQPAAWDTTEWHVPCDPVHNLFWEVGDHSLSLPVVMICAVEQCHAWRSGPWSRKGVYVFCTLTDERRVYNDSGMPESVPVAS